MDLSKIADTIIFLSNHTVTKNLLQTATFRATSLFRGHAGVSLRKFLGRSQRPIVVGAVKVEEALVWRVR
jgi:hypothetical protein